MNPTIIRNNLKYESLIYENGKSTITFFDKNINKMVVCEVKQNKNDRNYFEYNGDIYCHISNLTHPYDFRKITCDVNDVIDNYKIGDIVPITL